MKKRKRRFGLAETPESLERRSMLAANLIDVSKVAWNGQLVDAVKDEYVLRMPQLNARTATSPIDYRHNRPTVQPGWSLQSLGSGFYKLTAPGVTQATLTNWASRNGVQSVNVNAVRSILKTPNDPLYGDAANWAFPQIKAPDAWDTGTGTTSTIVAVLDSGVDYNHPDLAANMWRNPNEVPNDGIDNDNNGWIDDYYGVNTIGGNGNPMDDNGHGTFCAGLIGAVGDNGVGIAGVNWSVQIMAVKVFDAVGNTSTSAIVSGVQYVISQKIAGQNVAASNHSYGGYGFVQQEFDALSQLASTGVVIVAAAGNDSNNNDTLPAYPASYTIPGLISVAASTQSDTLASFSNYGVASVDLAAPGVSVLSTRSSLASETSYPPFNGNAGYSVSSGTSFAAPLVAGTAGLLKSLKLGASPEQIKTAILDGVDKIASLNGQVLTGGRLNVDRAVDLILSTQGAVPVATFTVGQSLSFLEPNAGFAYAEVKVSLDRPADPGKSVSVWYETRPGGSAFPGIDYEAASGLLTFSGRETQKSFRIKIIGDRAAEQDEQFAVQLNQAKSRGVTVGTLQTNIIILDDDNTTTPVQPGPTNPGLVPQVSVDVKRDANGVPLPIREGGVATFVIALDKTTTKPVSVRYRTNQPSLVPPGTALAGLDYTATQGTMTFAPGQRVKEFTVPILADRLTDVDETFRVVLTEPIGCDLAGAGATPSGAVSATITDVPFIPPPQPGFQITVSFPDSSLTPSQQQVFQQAATRWQEIIVGDLPNVRDPATGQVIDDILIVATASPLGGNTLAQAGPVAFRSGARGLPWKGEMQFNTTYVSSMMADGTFLNTVLHEMAHALGFGAIWQKFGLVQGVGTTNPIYVGANALREYRSLFGTPRATGVPVEANGGPGTAGGHWRKTIFRTELMTGSAEPAGVPTPISRITVGQFQDLGYQVNYTKADAYAKPTPLPEPPPGAGGGVANARLRLAAMAHVSRSAATPLPASEISRGTLSAFVDRAFASLVGRPRSTGAARSGHGPLG